MAIEKPINTEELQSKLCDMLEPSGWKKVLKGFILSQDFRNILDFLVEESSSGVHFTPKLKQLFRAFIECPYKELKLVILGFDPYPHIIEGVTVADGIAFSCSNTNKIQPSLEYIFKEVEQQIYPDGGYDRDLDLKRWSNQGILLLNSALTTRVGKTGVHSQIWKPFTTYVLDYLAWNQPGICFVFAGKVAQEFSEGMPTNNYQFKISHPASAAYSKLDRWDSKEIFKKVNEVLKSTNNTKIIW